MSIMRWIEVEMGFENPFQSQTYYFVFRKPGRAALSRFAKQVIERRPEGHAQPGL
jgi:hypothetical protein